MKEKIKEAFEKAGVPKDDRHKYLFWLLVDLFDGLESSQNNKPNSSTTDERTASPMSPNSSTTA